MGRGLWCVPGRYPGGALAATRTFLASAPGTATAACSELGGQRGSRMGAAGASSAAGGVPAASCPWGARHQPGGAPHARRRCAVAGPFSSSCCPNVVPRRRPVRLPQWRLQLERGPGAAQHAQHALACARRPGTAARRGTPATNPCSCPCPGASPDPCRPATPLQLAGISSV